MQTNDARQIWTAAAADQDSALVLGSLVDFMSAMRQRRAETTGTSTALTILAGRGPMRSADLASFLGLDQSTVSRHVSSLESAGLVVRVPVADDRRAHLVQLTESGMDAAHDLIKQKVADLEGVIASWTTEDKQFFATLLDRFAHGLVTERHNP